MNEKKNPSLDDVLSGKADIPESQRAKSKRATNGGIDFKTRLKNASDRQATNVEDNSASDLHTERKEANKAINMLLNALKVWTPMLTAVSSQSHAKSEEDASVDLHKIVRDCSDITTHLLSEMKTAGIPVEDESHKWVIRQVLANVSDSVTNQYKMKSKIDVETTKNLLSQVVSFTSGKIPESTKEANKPLVNDLLAATIVRIDDLKALFLQGDVKPLNIEEETAIQCSIIKASDEVISNLEWFSWYSDPEMHINKFSEMVLSGAGFFYERLISDFTVKPSRSSRVMLLQSAIDKSSKCLSAAYKKEAFATLSAMKEEVSQSDSKTIKREVIEHFKGIGVPYDRINENFERSLGLHISFTKSGAQFLKENLGGLVDGAKKPREQGRENTPS